MATQKTNEYLVGVGAHDDPQRTNLQFKIGKIRLYQGIVAVNDMKSRPSRGVEGAAPYRFVRILNTPTNQNLKNELTFCGEKVTYRSVEFSGLVAPENLREP